MTSSPDWKRVPAVLTNIVIVPAASDGAVRMVFGELVGKNTVTYHAALRSLGRWRRTWPSFC